MLTTPRLRPDLRARVVPGEGVFLFGGGKCVVIADPVCERVVPLIDGLRDSDDIAESLVAEIPLERVYFTLLRLEEAAYICESDQQDSDSGFWSASGLPVGGLRSQLRNASAQVSVHGELDADALCAALEQGGVRLGETDGLHIAYADDYLRHDLRELGRSLRAARRDWLLVRPVGRELWLGPLLGPGEGPCWSCLAFRLKAQRFLEGFVEARSGEAGPIGEPPIGLRTTRELAAQLTTLEVLKYFAAARRSKLRDAILSFDLFTGMTRRHAVLRRPQCECAGQPTREPKAIRLVSRPKAFRSDGGHRICTPSQTLDRFVHLVSPLTGIVDGIEMMEHREGDATASGLHVATAGYNFAFQFKNVRAFAENMRSRSAGKGMTVEQARAGALAEALERYSAIFHGDEPRVRGSYRELAPAAIHPNECMLFSEKQYSERQGVNGVRAGAYAERIPAPFDMDAVLDWSPIFSFDGREQRYLPTAYLFFPSGPDAPSPASSPYCYADSNGNAAGNALEEAVLQGFLELVERDSVAIWWYNRLHRPSVDLSSFGIGYFTEIRERYQALGRELWVLDLTSDLEIPAFAALSRRVRGREDVIFGFGCHLDARLGISRALTEMNQMLFLSFGENEEQGIARGLDRDLNEWFSTASVATEPYLEASGSSPKTIAAYRDSSTHDLLGDIELCRSRIERAGLTAYAIDQTRADVGMAAVKVIVPGLRHFWPRFAPGRLFEVPVALGVLPRPLREDELNPRRMFF